MLRQSAPSAASQWDAVLAALDSVPEALVVVDGDLRICFVNHEVVHRFGFAAAELRGQPVSRLVALGARSDANSVRWAEFPRRGSPAGAPRPGWVVAKDGTRRSVAVALGRLELDGASLGLCLLRATAEPRERPVELDVVDRLNEAQHIAKIGSWMCDLRTNEHWWSDELYRMLQIDPAKERRPFERYLELIHPADRQRAAERTALVAKGERLEPFDVRVVLPDGTQKVFQAQGAATFDDSGRAVLLHGTLQDVTEERAVQAALRLTETRYREAQRIAKVGNWEWDLATNTSWWSEELYRILEEDPRHYPPTFENFLAKVHPDDRQIQIEGQKVMATGADAARVPDVYHPIEVRLVLPGGREKIVEQRIEVRMDAQGKPVAIIGTLHDITERRALERRLRESEARYASTVELAAVGIAHVDLQGRFVWCNSRFCEMLGYDSDELLARTIRDVSHPEDVHLADADRRRLHAGEIDTLTVEKRYIRKDGQTIWVRITASPLRGAANATLYDVAIVEDITARKAAESRVQYLATHDELTGLPNRTLFGELLERAVDTARQHDRRCAVLFIDLDRFKIVNDALGHEAGDLLLKEVAARLRACLGEAGLVARLGGDEFVVLFEDLPSAEAAGGTARRILASMYAPFSIKGFDCRVTASIGVAVYPLHARDAAALMKHADMAMYLAKEEGKNNFQFYSADMSPMSAEHLELEVRLVRALERGEFSLQYQPRIEIATGAITGAEALLRWWNPDLGTVTPAQFIPLAEELGLIDAIGRWVLRTACEQNVAWQKRGLPRVVVSVNLSPRQFKDASLVDDVAATLAATGMAPELLEIEITEGMIMHHVEMAAAKAAAIKKLGVRLAIDDFGTGYSSLSQLKRFPIDTLKIDRAFVRDVPANPDDMAITKAVVSLGKALGVRVVAEGVETAAQYRFLRAHGCDELQGFYFAKPCHPHAFADLLKAPRKRRRR
jgi:diguanylate cyclase (GGDEF)-like protein/PAS domain S-box-containing protein